MKRLKRIDPWSAARVLGALYAMVGVLVGLFAACFTMVGVGAQSEVAGFGASDAAALSGLGVFAILVFPVIYGIIGLIAGVVISSLYNIVAGWTGGFEIELSND